MLPNNNKNIKEKLLLTQQVRGGTPEREENFLSLTINLKK
jgi:hypothetical protein